MTILVLVLLACGPTGCDTEKDGTPAPPAAKPPQPPAAIAPSPQPPPRVDPVSDHWTESGEQALTGKKCDTWWSASGTPGALFSLIEARVASVWPDSGYAQVTPSQARYRMAVAKDCFGQTREATVVVTTTATDSQTSRIGFSASFDAEDRANAVAETHAEADRLYEVTAIRQGDIQSGSVPSFQFPVPGFDPLTVPISSVFDHSMVAKLTADGVVEAFTGERGTVTGNWSITMGSETLRSLRKDASEVQRTHSATFLAGSGVYYMGGENLAYDGHPGYDFPVDDKSPVRAVAVGKVTRACKDGKAADGKDHPNGIHVFIEHSGGYVTKYCHLSSLSDWVTMGKTLTASDLQRDIGRTGNTGLYSCGSHLHFQVDFGSVPVDPYGWAGAPGADPYTQKNPGVENRWLWSTPYKPNR